LQRLYAPIRNTTVRRALRSAVSCAVPNRSGFTLIEVLVAIVILLVGVLGTVSLIDGANAGTSRNKAREGGTNVARSILEVARSVSYRDLDEGSLEDALSQRPGLADAQGMSGYQIESRGQFYDLSITSCSMDDPKDGLGPHDEAAVHFCPDSDALAAGQKGTDRNPDDYKRVSVTLTWKTHAITEKVKETTLISNPVGGLGPSVIDLRPTTPNTVTITDPSTKTAGYAATTSTPAANLSWAIDGDVQGQASGSGTSWSFNWSITRGDGTPVFVDCTYVVSATAFDDKGRAGAPKALTVVLNRFAPFAPRGFAGGRNLNGNRVDVEWLPNDECDVVGYRVYRGTSPSSITQLVCPSDGSQFLTASSCVDQTAPAPAGGQQLYYKVVAVDKDPSNALREGAASVIGPIAEGDNPPTTPANLAACSGGASGCNDADGAPAPDGTTVLSWDPSTDPDANDGILFYRIYRDGATYANRYAVLYPVAGKPLVFIDNKNSGGPHDYRVSAVDKSFGESALSGVVTR
jgi:prepilin-type N-terminal cleavage/methylation domain-containing protein